MRCPACGARNGERAPWCTQCYAPLGTVTEPPVADVPTRDTSARDVRTRDGEVEWRCARCDGWNPLGAAVCVACGAPRAGFGAGTQPPPVAVEDRGRLLLASALLPGLGHLLARRTGTGAARVILAVTWLVGAVVIARDTDGALAPVLPLLLGTVVLWLASLRDVTALVDDRPELLTPRVLAGLTGGVVVLLLVTVLSSFGTVRPGG